VCVLVGDLGSRLARRFHFPSPAVIGSMLAVGLVSSVGLSLPGLMPVLRSGIGVAVGAVLGLRVSRDLFGQLRSMVGPAVVVSAWAVATGLLGGYLLAAFANMTQATALFAATPGGIAEMTLAAASFGAHTPTVAALQLTRLVGVLLAVSAMVNGRRHQVPATGGSASGKVVGLVQTLTLLGGAAVGGLFLQSRGVPAGTIIGAMVATSAAGLTAKTEQRFHPAIIHWSQVGVGMVVGLSFTAETFVQLATLVLPALLLNGVMVASGVGLAHLLHRWTGWDMVTCLLASAPAGISQMGILSEAVGANVCVVSLLHVVRLVTVIGVLLPLLGAL
jgi:membrane AbrB-like protein